MEICKELAELALALAQIAVIWQGQPRRARRREARAIK